MRGAGIVVSGNIVFIGVLRGRGRPGDGELHGGLHGAVHELEQVQGILHLHGIKLLQVGLRHKCFFSAEAEMMWLFHRRNLSGGSTMAVASALVPLVRRDRRTSLESTSPGEN